MRRLHKRRKKSESVETWICHVIIELKEIDVREQWPELKTIIQYMFLTFTFFYIDGFYVMQQI